MNRVTKPRKRRQSPRILDRRARIIEKTRQLVAERGIEAVTIRDLAADCGVAVATLYNQFGSREGVIGAALEADFRGRFEPLALRTRNLSPAKKLEERITLATRAMFTELREYTKSVMFFYFHHSATPELRAAIHDYAASDFTHIVEEIRRHGDLQPWVDPVLFADDIITQNYALVMKWAQGYIKDRDLHSRVINAIGASFVGITRGKTRAEFERLMAA
ncbi:MAG: TetR/AcrR family transcriptional regulator [Proteobacteria bacterium]|nr:TetR/AcrR family transcriptional regulator [Pseudomonadota bacterium]